MDCTMRMPRKPWDLPFLAESEEVGALRRILRTRLGLWGLHESIEAAQLCVSELVANVINHVGPGTPTTLVVSMNGTHLRIEVHDPDPRALPMLKQASVDSEGGRGMAVVDAVAERWGVQVHPERKVTWCELATGLVSPGGPSDAAGVVRAEALLDSYVEGELPHGSHLSRLGMKMAEDAVIGAIADFLHWLRAHGCDAEEVLDRAQMHFEGQITETAGVLGGPAR